MQNNLLITWNILFNFGLQSKKIIMKKINFKAVSASLSRKEMKTISGGSGEGYGNLCHFHYTGTLWSNYTIIKRHSGGCESTATSGCYEYRATGSC